MILLTSYLSNQVEFIERSLRLFSDDSLGLSLKAQYQSYSSLVLSSEFTNELLVDQIASRLKKEQNYEVLCDDHEFFVCRCGNDVGTLVVSVILNKQHITVNINL